MQNKNEIQKSSCVLLDLFHMSGSFSSICEINTMSFFKVSAWNYKSKFHITEETAFWFWLNMSGMGWS